MKKEELLEIYNKQYEAKVKIVSKNAKKKRVLYSLLVVLVITLCYEFQNEIMALFSDKPAVAVEKKEEAKKDKIVKLNLASFKRLVEPFDKIRLKNPQLEAQTDALWTSLNGLLYEIHHDKANNNTVKGKEMLDKLYQFSIQPVVSQTKEVKDFQNLIKTVAKQNNKIVVNDQPVIVPLVYSKELKHTNPGKRNLFEYGEIND